MATFWITRDGVNGLGLYSGSNAPKYDAETGAFSPVIGTRRVRFLEPGEFAEITDCLAKYAVAKITVEMHPSG